MHRLESNGSPDCVVIGGGIIGLAVARRLAADGLSVTVVERGRCGGEASWAGAGVLTPCNPHRRDLVADLRDRSLALYPQFCASLQEETGIDPEYENCGELEIALNEDALRSLREDEAAGADQRMPDGGRAYQFHSPQDTRFVEPAASTAILGSLECRRTAQVRNPRILKALVASCRRHHVRLWEETTVQGLLVDRSCVMGVRTDKGQILAGTTILCAGAWSGQFPEVANTIRVQPVRGQMILMRFEQRPFHRVIARGKTYLVPRRDGHVLLGATEEHDGSFSKRTTAAGIAGLIQRGMKLVPGIADATMIAQWTGLRPGTPDDRPYIGPVPALERLFAATGHYRAGLILTPITAELVNDVLLKRRPSLDLSPIMPGRSVA